MDRSHDTTMVPAPPGPEAPAPQDVATPSPPPTGDPTIDAALERVADDTPADLQQRIDAVAAAHRFLADRLADSGTER